MVPLAITALPPASACALVALSSDSAPDFVLAAERCCPRFMAARWRRRSACLTEPARLDDHLLSYCVRGGAESTIVVDGVHMHSRQRSGAVTLLPAGRRVQWRFEARSDVVHLHLYIAASALHEQQAQSRAAAAPDLPLLFDLHDPWLDAFFRLMAAEYDSCKDEAAIARFDLLDHMSGPLVQHLLALAPATRSGPGGTTRAAPLRAVVLRRIESFIDGRLERKISLAQLAAMAALSEDHFVRAFQQATGATPHSYILQRRLDHACTLLRNDSEPIATVARRCGFSGPSHFSASFHEHRGMTPSQYRRNAV